MIIGIDGNEANVNNRVGSNIFAYEVLKRLWETKNENIKYKNDNLKFKIYLKQKPLSDLPQPTDWWQYQVLKPEFLWTQWRLPWELYFGKEKPALFFTPGHYAPRFCPMPLVISIMDLAFLRFPDQFRPNDLYQLINWTKYSVLKANHIFAISQFTKKEIVHFYHIPDTKITVVYPGIENAKLKTQNSAPAGGQAKPQLKTQIFEKFSINNKFFLYLGTLQPRKNLVRLIKAFSQLAKQFPDYQLVISGKKGWLYDEIFNKVKDLDLQKHVVFTGFISEEEKIGLLKSAFSFVLPSLYEGFGLPILEAFTAGCPVILANNSSLPEVGGQAALYIADPTKAASIYQSLLKMIKLGSGERQKMIQKGFAQAKKFSWEESGKKVYSILSKNGGQGVSI